MFDSNTFEDYVEKGKSILIWKYYDELKEAMDKKDLEKVKEVHEKVSKLIGDKNET